MKHILALADCNNFYVSCERVFNANLKDRPVVVLSNNDGCVVARSNEVKALGIKMGTPVFECRTLIEKHNIFVFSSNYALYADMSDRVMKTLKTFSPNVEVYSIDEAFLDLSHIPVEALLEYGREMRLRVWQHTGIPISVGIATTKTLAKIANEIAKKDALYQGVLNIAQTPPQAIDTLLEKIDITDVWGIGSRYAARLQSIHISTARDLKAAPTPWIRKQLKVVGERTVLELRGIACLPLETKPKPKKGIMTSKSFGKPVESLGELEEAVATYTARAAEKLRAQNSFATSISVFIQTNYFHKDMPQYMNSASRIIPLPTAFTPDFIGYALEIVRSIYKKGYKYKKAGVFLSKIVPQDILQSDLFGDFSFERLEKKAALMKAVDLMNKIWGQNTLFFGAQGIGREWKMRQERRSPRYTTRWNELLSTSQSL